MGLLNTFGMSLSVFSEIPGMTSPPSMAVAAQDFEHEISNILDNRLDHSSDISVSLDHLCASSYAFTNLDDVGDLPRAAINC